MDFHTAFRKLCFFRPSRAEDPAYVVKFADDLIVSTTTSLPADSRDAAKRGLMPWLEIYAKRLQLPEEVQAWDSTKLCASEKDVVLYGEVTSGEAWEAKRETLMKRVNPRFVLRQWVLEETISELERTGSDEIREGRRRLAKVLDVSGSCIRIGSHVDLDRWRRDRSCRGAKMLLNRGRMRRCVSWGRGRCWGFSVAVLANLGASWHLAAVCLSHETSLLRSHRGPLQVRISDTATLSEAPSNPISRKHGFLSGFRISASCDNRCVFHAFRHSPH